METNQQAAHYITNLLLRRFARSGKILVEDKSTGVVTAEQTDNVGKIDHPTEWIQESEAKWQSVETAMGPVFSAVRLHQLEENPDYITVIKDFLTLHYTRSNLTYILRDEAVKSGEAKRRLDDVHKSVSKQVGRPLTDSEIKQTTEHWFKTSMEELPIGLQVKLFDDVRPFVAKFGIIVYEAPNNADFILGDSPVITMTEDGKVGALQGARIDDSKYVGMPLSPKYAIGLKGAASDIEYQQLTAVQVDSINKAERSIAHKYIFSRPPK